MVPLGSKNSSHENVTIKLTDVLVSETCFFFFLLLLVHSYKIRVTPQVIEG